MIELNACTPSNQNIRKNDQPQKTKNVSKIKFEKKKTLIVAATLVTILSGLFLIYKDYQDKKLSDELTYVIDPQNVQQQVVGSKYIGFSPKQARELLNITGLKYSLRQIHLQTKLNNPKSVLKMLEKARCVENLTEKPFIVGTNKHITAGRKFSFTFHSRNGKKYNMIFEVHDYIKDVNGERTWVMRIYDEDDIKSFRNYLSIFGNFIKDSYNEPGTHIPCGRFGEIFVNQKQKVYA